MPPPPADNATENTRSRSGNAVAWIVVVALAVVALSQSIALVARTSSPDYNYIYSDGVAYDWIAQDFLNGDFRVRYIDSGFAHRQFLYPLTVAGFRKCFLDDDAAFRWVNVIAHVLTVPLIFLAVRGLAGALAGLVCTALFVFNPYFLVHGTLALSDTLFLFLTSAALALITARHRAPTRRLLFAAGLMAGLSYLTRPNGLFFAGAVTIGLLALPIFHRSARRWRTLSAVGLFVLGFVTAAAPSLVARTAYKGNPLYHEYLDNYLWADTYAGAHKPGPPRFDVSTYFEHHTWRENLDRLWEGAADIFWRDTSAFDPLFGVAWLVAIPLAMLSRRTVAWTTVWLIVLLLVALPLAWSYRTNPTIRVPYFALYPLQLLIIGAGLYALGDRFRRATTMTAQNSIARANRLRHAVVVVLGVVLVVADLTGLGLWTTRATRLNDIRKIDLNFYHAAARVHAWNKSHPGQPASAPIDIPPPVKPW